MKMLARITLVLSVGHFLILSVGAQSRPNDAGARNGTISGRVTAEGRPLSGIAIALRSSGRDGSQPFRRTATDAQGRYQFSAVTPGTYEISPLSPRFVLPDYNRLGSQGLATSKIIAIGEGEDVSNVDLALVRGCVVTGKITDPEGRPLIEQDVQLHRLDGALNPYYVDRFTDDRGIYRIFGLPPGKYRVSTGEGEDSITANNGRRSFGRTFHPDVTDVSQATIVEVGDGAEAAGIDIRMSAAVKTYSITGRAVDAETKELVSNIRIFASSMLSEAHSEGTLVDVDARGEFRIENLRPRRYLVYAGNNSLAPAAKYGYSDPVPVELIDGDATGVEIRVKRAEGAISGVAVIEGVTDPEILARLPMQGMGVSVVVQDNEFLHISPQLVQIAADGSFRVEGLRPGRASFNQAFMHEPDAGLTLLRIEREGIRVDEIEIGPGKEVKGIRIVFGNGNGIVRGRVIVNGGSLPEGAFFWVNARRSDESRGRGVRTDARGAFAIEGLPPGQYEVYANPVVQGPLLTELRRRAPAKQTVSVANGQTIQVTFTIDLSQREQKQ